MTPQQINQANKQSKIWLDQNKEFIKNHPLKIIQMTKKEIELEKAKTEKFIKNYELDKPISNNTSQPN